MSGKNENLLRRRRTKYYKSSAFKRVESEDVFDFKTDYSNQKSWQDCISRIAIAQSEIGVKSAMACVESVVRTRELRKGGYIYCSPAQLEEALRRMRKEFVRMKK